MPPMSDTATVSITVVEPPLPVALSNLTIHHGLFHFNFTAQPGKTYRIQTKPTLDAPNWLDLYQLTADQPTLQFVDPLDLNGTRYYRVITLE